jgi:hypothetical protein
MDKKLSKIIGKIDKIIDDGNIYWYYYSSNLLKPITKSTSDKKGRKIVEKYVNDNDSNIIKFIIKFEIITDLDVLKSSIKQDKGILTIYCDVYSIKSNMKISKSSSKGRSKVIWFTHDEIIEHKLNEKEFEKMFKKIAYCIFYEKIKMSPFIDITINDIINTYKKTTRYDIN